MPTIFVAVGTLPPSLVELPADLVALPTLRIRACIRILAARFRPSDAIILPPSQTRGRRECRVRAAPAVSCAKNCTFGAHEHTGQRKHSDIPCAMALRLTSCSPR